jgi:hypothetical protein
MSTTSPSCTLRAGAIRAAISRAAMTGARASRLGGAGALAAALCLAAGPAPAVSFVVAETPGSEIHGDSYVIDLLTPADISHARALIAQGPAAGEPILFARIAAGADGHNRDWLAEGRPPWSWHVTEFVGFGDLGVELYDGWPTYVESDVAGWIENTGGMIGFWTYTVVSEIPEPACAFALGLGLVAISAARRTRRGP